MKQHLNEKCKKIFLKNKQVFNNVFLAPIWSQKSLTALIEADEQDHTDELKMLDFPSLADMAKDAEVGFKNENLDETED